MASAPAPTDRLELVAELWPPFVDHSNRARIALELVETALERAGVANKVTVTDGGMPSMELVQDGTFVAAAAAWHSKAREEFTRFSEPYLENRLVLVGRRGSHVNIESAKELAGKSLAVVDHYAYGVAEPPKGLEVVRGFSVKSNLEAVARGEVDYTLIDELVVRHIMRVNPSAAGLFEIGTKPVLRRGLHLAVRKDHPRGAEILARFDAEIRKMLTDGSYNRALGMDWILVDESGNGPAKWSTDRAKVGVKPPHLSYTVRYLPEGAATGGFLVNGREYATWEEIPQHLKSEPTDRCTSETACAVPPEWSLSL